MLLSLDLQAQHDSTSYRQRQDSMDMSVYETGNFESEQSWKTRRLSNFGGARQALSFDPTLDVSPFKTSGYDAYLTRKKTFNYHPNWRFTQLHYTTMIEDGQFISAEHHQAFKNFSFGLFYQKLLSTGDFSENLKNHSNTNFEFNYTPENSNYSSTLSLLYRLSKVQENGGFADDDLYTNQTLNSNAVLPTRLSHATNTIKNFELSLAHFWKLNLKDLPLELKLTSGYSSQKEQYRDENPLSTSNFSADPYYPVIYNDSTVTNDSVYFRTFSQDFELELTSKSEEHSLLAFLNLDWTSYQLGFGKKQNDSQTFGLKWTYKSIIDAKAQIQKTQDLDPALSTFLSLNPLKKLNLSWIRKKQAPSLFQQEYSSNHFRWENNFNWITSNSFSATYRPKKHIDLKGFYHHATEVVYFDEQASVSNVNGLLKLYGLESTAYYKLKRWESKLNVLVQETESDVFNYPKFVAQFQLAYNSGLFGEARFQPGINVRYFSSYHAPNYMTSSSSFYLQNTSNQGGKPIIDLFANLKVKGFVLYGIYENVFFKSSIKENFHAPHYSGINSMFRFGIRWNFYDN
ncbi:MAG: putative porin [Flavobacteriales bacterium]